MGGAALVKTINTMMDKAKTIAARLLQAQSVDYANGRFSVTGEPDRAIALLDVAAAENLDTYVWNMLDLITFPNGCHIAEVEVDPETGHVVLERYTAVDDFGTLINPMLALGQIHGGVAQGIGQAMLEHTVYDSDSGQLLSGSLMDYALPRADDLPDFDIALTGVPTNANPLGVKGAGQAGAIAAPQAVVLAVLDAIGVDTIDMPLTPERVWRAINNGKHP
jgi:carbon-monoxide dehydrogenase large subunit